MSKLVAGLFMIKRLIQTALVQSFKQLQWVVVEFETHLQDFVHGKNFALEPEKIGGAEGIRTPDLANASRALCQLSYSPTVWKSNGTRQYLALSSKPYGSKDRRRFAVIDFQEFIC